MGQGAAWLRTFTPFTPRNQLYPQQSGDSPPYTVQSVGMRERNQWSRYSRHVSDVKYWGSVVNYEERIVEIPVVQQLWS